MANPPFSANWEPEKAQVENDDRFSIYGKFAPKTKADLAFVQHMISQLADDGTMAVVLPHGVLFRGAAEGHIRQYLIEQMNCLDAVIGLPANIFYGTSIPTCVLVFKKCRRSPDDILFIDASQHFDKVKTQNVLRPEHIEKIVETYKARVNEDKYSYVASIEQIRGNDFNLNIPRYVDTFEEEEEIDLGAIALELRSMDRSMEDNDRMIRGFCEELGIDAPF